MEDCYLANVGGEIQSVPISDFASESKMRWWGAFPSSGDNPKLHELAVTAWKRYTNQPVPHWSMKYRVYLAKKWRMFLFDYPTVFSPLYNVRFWLIKRRIIKPYTLRFWRTPWAKLDEACYLDYSSNSVKLVIH